MLSNSHSHSSDHSGSPCSNPSSSSTLGHPPQHVTSRRSWHAAVQHCLHGTSLAQELSGSLGDLGTFLPLVVALSASIHLDLGTTLLFSGLYNVLSGVGFRIPMCVQPMKTIAAVALSAPGLSLPEVMSAGLFVGGVMLLCGLTGAMDLVNRAVPGSIVRGIQLAVGLQLAQKGLTQVFRSGLHSYRQPWGVEGCVLGICAALFLLVTTLPKALAQQQQQEQGQLQEQQQQQEHGRTQEQQQQQQLQPQPQQQHLHQQQEDPQSISEGPGGCCSASSSSSTPGPVPSALLLVLLGLLLTMLTSPGVLSQLQLGPSKPKLYLPTWQTLKDGVLKAGLAQLPLTSLNSVIAVSHLALQLFPDQAGDQGWRWRPGAVAVSVGVMNLMGCWFGAFPCCHGSGGLAAQYKFGARTGLAPVLLGGMKVLLALLFGSSLLQLLQHFPKPLLGALLLVSGLELAASARKKSEQRGYCFMLLTAAAIMGLNNTAIGFAVGWGGFLFVAVFERGQGMVQKWWQLRALQQYKPLAAKDRCASPV